MAKQVKLSAQTRSASGRTGVNKLRPQGIVPAIIYGGKSQPQSLQVAARDIHAILAHATGENVLVELEIDDNGAKASRTALIQEVQHHPLGGAVLHVDFHAISMDETIDAEIPVEPQGEPTGVKNYGGILEQNLRSLEVECLPKDLPDVIVVDVSGLNIGDVIHVKDLKLPEGVKALNDEDIPVFAVAEPRVEEEPVAAEAPTAPEVITEKKKEEPEAEKKSGADKKG